MIRCPQCQAELEEGKRFCPQCGARLTEPPGDAGKTMVTPPEGDAGKTMVVPPEPPSSGAPSSSAGLQTILEDPARRQSPPPAGGGFGLPPAAPPTTPSAGGGFGVPPSPPPPAGGGAGKLPSAPPSAVGGGSGAPAAVTTARKGPNWLLIIGIIFGVLVLACILILGGLYLVGQQAAQSLGTAVAVTAVSIGLLRAPLASEATSQFTAEQTESGDYRFENGAFVIEAFNADQIVWQTIDEVIDDASFEIEATVDKPRSAAIALLFRYQDNQNFYILSVDGNGRYRVARYVNDEFSVLSDWKSSPAINAAGSSNRLRIEMAGDALTFFCNGQRLTSLQDSAFLSGNLAFGTETFDEGQGVVRFTNLVVRGR